MARRMRGSFSGRRCVFIARYETSAAGAIASREIGVQAHERQIVGRELLDDVGGARLQRLQPLARVGHGEQHEVARARRLVPVVGLRSSVMRSPGIHSTKR